MVLDRIVELYSPVVSVGPSGQRQTTYVSEGDYHAAFNPLMGDSRDIERLYTATEVDLFVIRAFSGIEANWMLRYEGVQYDILAVSEGVGNDLTRPRGRYTALKCRTRSTDQIVLPA